MGGTNCNMLVCMSDSMYNDLGLTMSLHFGGGWGKGEVNCKIMSDLATIVVHD